MSSGFSWNQTPNSLILTNSTGVNLTAELFSFNGRKIDEFTVEKSLSIKLNDLGSGAYVVRVRNGNSAVKPIRFVKK